MPEITDISIENPAVGGSSTVNIMMRGVTEKAATSSSFSKRVKNTLGFFFLFTRGTRIGDEVDTHKGNKDNQEIDDSESQVSWSRHG